jgi:hypothetical protein
VEKFLFSRTKVMLDTDIFSTFFKKIFLDVPCVSTHCPNYRLELSQECQQVWVSKIITTSNQSFSQFCGMFDRLKARWKVNSWSLFLILTTFALGGSTCGKLAKMLIPDDLNIHVAIWWLIYVLIVTLLWPLCVLIISIPLGQFRFFKNYLQRIASRMTGKK